MHPMRLITYALLTSVVSLVAMGGIGFYVGYTAGRGDIEELKSLVVAGGNPEGARAIAEALKQQSTAPAPQASVDLEPVLAEIRTMSAQIGKLEEQAEKPQADVVGDTGNDDPAAPKELANVRQLLSETNEQFQGCRRELTTLQTKFDELQASSQKLTLTSTEGRPTRDAGSVVLFDNVLLKRDQNKLYRDVDVALSLQSIASRSAKVAVNQQSLGIAFGERKIFQHREVTCELVLMETDLEGNKARFSIACKR